MAHASLAALYRPQTFAQVVGQDMVKSILSRAAQEDRVAPAYLLSGTRGVGKTTIARIFAKALNCAHAPTGEPCNECEACRRITQGGFVDVVEIDGASNRGIDDVRRLRDAVGYAPLEGRYKVFIIDEAHMLTKEAFNALLKTLEEPPPRVTFILATTEQHKFPVTIVSRCQHFVFRQIPEATLEAHVTSVLEREGRPFEPEAARLIARRAAGSVRDAMSLLGQVLALGGAGDGAERLTARQTRDVLGLAGQEIMDRLLNALAGHDATGVAALVRELLLQGADMGFFLRELGTLWRNLFLLRQAGEAAAAELDLPEADIRRLADMAARFSLTYIHAAWQMTLDGQRRILTSLEPAAGLELLLLNLALLPRLLPLAELDTAGFKAGSGPTPAEMPPSAPSAPAVTSGASAPDASHEPEASPTTGASESRSAAATKSTMAPVAAAPRSAFAPPVRRPLDSGAAVDASVASGTSGASATNQSAERPPLRREAASSAVAAPVVEMPAYLLDEVPPPELDGPAADDAVAAYLADIPGEGEPAAPTFAGERASASRFSPPRPAAPARPSAVSERRETPADPVSPASVDSVDPESAPLDPSLRWDDFLVFCEGRSDVPVPMLRQFDGAVRGHALVLCAHSQVMLNQLQRPSLCKALEAMAAEWAGRPLRPVFLPPAQERRTESELRNEMLEHPVVRTLQTLYDATLLRCTPVDEIR